MRPPTPKARPRGLRRARAVASRVAGDALGRALGLPPATTPDVEVRRGLEVRMPDEVTLLADLHRPRGAGPLPTVLVRSPYGRAGPYGLLNARIFAERGLQVLLQSVRGTFGSGGDFEPFRERDDGLATLAWIREQPWHEGPLATTGASYLGIVQWAVAADAPDLVAMTAAVTASDFRGQTYPGGAFSLDTALAWTQLVELQERRLGLLRQGLRRRRLRRAMDHLPLADADRALVGRHVPFFQAWLEHDAPGDAYWAQRGFGDRVEEVRAVVDLVAGWYDIFLPWQVQDFERLRAAGRDARLTIGPWAHVSPGLAAAAAGSAVRTLRAELAGSRRDPRAAPVRVYVTGAREWHDLSAWPPPDATPQRWHLQPRGALSPSAPAPSDPDRYRYDPADPTPALAGPVLVGRAKPTNNARLEARADVLTYTSA